MIPRLLIATKNPGKFAEIKEMLSALPITLYSLADLGETNDIKETGTTHCENAIQKARYFFKKTDLPTLGEDSGIYIDAFPGELGVATRRWAGLHSASDEKWITYFLEKMQNVPYLKRGATFMCFAALIIDKNSFHKPYIFSGETRGKITENLEAPLENGIPISSCFKPENSDKVYAALSTEEKNRISHRGKAIYAVKVFLLRGVAQLASAQRSGR